ncbi:hypothetical protein [Asaia sp. As-1742]|nr:hypothetical protein [Asaia sp. As-1742]
MVRLARALHRDFPFLPGDASLRAPITPADALPCGQAAWGKPANGG